MITLARGYFNLSAPYLSEAELESYAETLFEIFDRAASLTLPLPDYGLALAVEEGSLKGKGRILATGAALYFGIGQFGSFVQGLREIRAIGGRVTGRLLR